MSNIVANRRPKYGGRQKGTPNKATADVKALAGKYGPDAIEELWAIAKKSQSDAAKVAAIKELLDRAYGKATQIIGGDNDNPLKAVVAVRLCGPDD